MGMHPPQKSPAERPGPPALSIPAPTLPRNISINCDANKCKNSDKTRAATLPPASDPPLTVLNVGESEPPEDHPSSVADPTSPRLPAMAAVATRAKPPSIVPLQAMATPDITAASTADSGALGQEPPVEASAAGGEAEPSAEPASVEELMAAASDKASEIEAGACHYVKALVGNIFRLHRFARAGQDRNCLSCRTMSGRGPE